MNQVILEGPVTVERLGQSKTGSYVTLKISASNNNSKFPFTHFLTVFSNTAGFASIANLAEGDSVVCRVTGNLTNKKDQQTGQYQLSVWVTAISVIEGQQVQRQAPARQQRAPQQAPSAPRQAPPPPQQPRQATMLRIVTSDGGEFTLLKAAMDAAVESDGTITLLTTDKEMYVSLAPNPAVGGSMYYAVPGADSWHNADIAEVTSTSTPVNTSLIPF